MTSVNALLRAWIGTCCSAVDRREFSWRFNFGTIGSITAECPWRIIARDSIALCSRDEGQLFGRSAPVDAESDARSWLLDKQIREVAIAPIKSDLRIVLHDGVVLELFNNSSGYEAWQANSHHGGRHVEIIAMGGGELAIFEQKTM